MNNHLSAELLQFLLQLYEQGSLSKACSCLGISQPAGSRLLSTLREIFHDELFLKTRTGMVPSERCERLIPNAEKTLQSLLALTQEEIFDPARLTKNFRLGIVDNAFFSIFLPVVNEIQRAAPGVTFEIPDIRFSALTKYVDYLSSNEVDLLIYPYKDSEVPKSVRFFKLFEDHFVYITRKGHPLEKVPPEEIHLHVNDYQKVRVSARKKFFFSDPSDQQKHLSSSQCFIKSPFFVSSAFACLVADVVVVLPETTARTLSQWLPITIYKTPQLGEAPFYPTLYWHESKNADPANQWLRSIIISHTRSSLGNHPTVK